MDEHVTYSANGLSEEGLRRFRDVALEQLKSWDHASASNNQGLTLRDLETIIAFCDRTLHARSLGEPVLPVPSTISRALDVLRPEVLDRRAKDRSRRTSDS